MTLSAPSSTSLNASIADFPNSTKAAAAAATPTATPAIFVSKPSALLPASSSELSNLSAASSALFRSRLLSSNSLERLSICFAKSLASLEFLPCCKAASTYSFFSLSSSDCCLSMVLVSFSVAVSVFSSAFLCASSSLLQAESACLIFSSAVCAFKSCVRSLLTSVEFSPKISAALFTFCDMASVLLSDAASCAERIWCLFSRASTLAPVVFICVSFSFISARSLDISSLDFFISLLNPPVSAVNRIFASFLATFRHLPLAAVSFSFFFYSVVQPSIIGGFVFYHAKQKRIISVPKYIFRNFKDQNIIGVVILYIFQFKFRWFYSLLP